MIKFIFYKKIVTCVITKYFNVLDYCWQKHVRYRNQTLVMKTLFKLAFVKEGGEGFEEIHVGFMGVKDCTSW